MVWEGHSRQKNSLSKKAGRSKQRERGRQKYRKPKCKGRRRGGAVDPKALLRNLDVRPWAGSHARNSSKDVLCSGMGENNRRAEYEVRAGTLGPQTFWGWKKAPCRHGTPKPACLAFTSAGRAFSAAPAAPSLAAGPLAAGSRARADPEGRAPAPGRPRAACQPRLEGSALYGPRAGRKCLVGPGEEAPYMARGGRGLAGGGELAGDGGRFRRRGPKPQRATPTRARACGLPPRRRPATPDPSAGSALCRTCRNGGLPPGSDVLPSRVGSQLCDLG